jgi:hypothetical protein
MKKSFLILTCLMVVGGSMAWAETVALSGSGSPTPAAAVVSDTATETVITYNLDGFVREKVAAEGSTYDHIRLEGRGCSDEVGLPEMPAINETVMIQGDRKVRVDIVTWDEVTLADYNVLPFQTPATDLDAELPFVCDDAFYAGNTSYPKAKVELGTPGIFRDIRVVSLRVNPFRWNPATKELTVATKIAVKLTYYGQGEINTKADSPYRCEGFEPLYRASVINYKPGLKNPGLDANLTNAQHLFICYPDYEDEAEAYAEFLNKMGIYTKVVTTTTTGTTKENIKAYIQSEYDSVSPAVLEYVLLVGDIDYVAAGYWPGYSMTADYWYSCLTGGESDPYPDVNVGRYSTKDAAKLTYFIEKAIKYQKDPDLTGDWLDKTMLCAHYQDAPGKYEGCCEEVANYSYSLFTPTFIKIYGSTGKRNSDITDTINAGVNIATYRGHGSETAWTGWSNYGDYFYTTNVHALANGDKTPIWLNICCLNGNFAYGGENFIESNLNSTGKAGIASNSASDPSYTIPNHDYLKEMYKAVYDQGILNCGRVSNYGNTRLIQIYGPYHTYMKNVYMYAWNGDPYTKIWMKKPTMTLAASHPSTYNPIPSNTFTCTVTDEGDAPVEGALVGLYMKDDIYCAGTTNSSGVVELKPTPRIGNSGTMYVTATKDGYLGYWGTCTVEGTNDIKIQSFTARRVDEGIRVSWNAYDDGELLGFNLYRLPIADDATAAVSRIGGSRDVAESTSWVKVNEELISGQNPYTYLDDAGEGSFSYKLEAVTIADPFFAGPIRVNSASAPRAYALSQNYPNPARTNTTISFSLPTATSDVKLHVYDITGRVIKTMEYGTQPAGVVNIPWNLTDNDGQRIPAGVYLYRLETPNFSSAKRMVVTD